MAGLQFKICKDNSLKEEQQDLLADGLEDLDSDSPTSSVIFMARLSLEGSVNGDDVNPTYHLDILFEVPHYDTYHGTYMINPVVQETEYSKHLVSNNDSYDELTCDKNVISYVDYMVTIKNDVSQSVPPPEQDNAMTLFVIEQMQSQVERCNMQIHELLVYVSASCPFTRSGNEKNLPSKRDLDILFQPMFDEYFRPSPSVVSLTLSVATLPQAIVDETFKISIDQDAPSLNTGFDLIAFADADHAGCQDSRKSTLGSFWVKSYDSKSAIALSWNTVQHLRMKHIAFRYHFIKEHVENEIVQLYFVKMKLSAGGYLQQRTCTRTL
uniref:Retrovirus-related Pol polyprotein from transposon TNT 1-94 n=1 Tax=Tanacetum cinerariifolium TaxID=118510 RepID=A0A6L2J415_TANCI|nr:hypothetical protein [Tanacetum cinerariifolium]